MYLGIFLSTSLLLLLTFLSISCSATPISNLKVNGSHTGGVVEKTRSDSRSSAHSNSAASSVITKQRYPRNLHRLYDGTWEASGSPPFTSIPPPRDSRLSGDSLSRNNTTISTTSLSHVVHAPDNSIHDLAFTRKSGFALLRAENHNSDLNANINIVFGELLLRDGPYRSPRDVSLYLIGLYRWSTGTMVVVGDELFEDTSSALQRLYHAYTTSISSNDSKKPLNITEETFITTLSPRFSKHRKQFRAQRPGTTRHPTIGAQCPFTATFDIGHGNFNDQPPRDNEYSGMTSYNNPPSNSNDDRPMVGAGGANIFDTARPPTDFISNENGTFSISGQRETTSGIGFQTSGVPKDEFVEMKGVFKSEVCNTEITIILSTLDTEMLVGKAINYTLLVTIVAFIQVIVLIRQMEMTSTQACARRISLMTVGLQAVADSYLCLGHLTMGIAVQPLFNAFATAAFFKFICFSIFLMRWMLLIWKARRPEGFADGWDAMRRELSMLYSRFYGSLLLGIFLLYQMQNQLRFFLFALYSFWVPQIVLNVVGDYRRPLLPSYIIGTSLTRLVIPLYFWGCPHNFLHIKPQPISAIALVIWLLSQALILLSQYKFGPRWFIPKKLLPERYDYYRPITLDNETTGDADVEAQDGREQEPLVVGNADTRRECCICMETVDINSPDRMVTPCNHFFHAKCLEQWLEVRLECALCRTRVPQI